MFRKSTLWGLIGVLVSLLLVPGAVLSDTGGESLTPDGQWRMLDGAERHWYAFEYDGDRGQITIRMDLEPSEGANFKLLTPAGFRTWMDDGEIESIGSGAPNAWIPADLVWSGSFNERGTYRVIVQRTGVKPGPAYYALSVEGDGVWFPTPVEAASAPEAVPAVSAEAAQASLALEEPAGGTGPADALNPTGDWISLNVGQAIWFAFHYEGRGSAIQIYMDASPSSGAVFSIWTPEQIRFWARGDEVSPVGRGAEDEFAPGDLSWSGSFANPDTYYVKVEHAGSVPSSFALHVEGDDVWW